MLAADPELFDFTSAEGPYAVCPSYVPGEFLSPSKEELGKMLVARERTRFETHLPCMTVTFG